EMRNDARILDCIMNSVGEGLVVADHTGKFLFFNRAAEQILGVGATKGSPEDWAKAYGVFDPETLQPFPLDRMPLIRAIRGEVSNDVEMLIRNPNVPEGICISVSGRPLRNERISRSEMASHGSVEEEETSRGGVVVFRDITERKRAEATRALVARLKSEF